MKEKEIGKKIKTATYIALFFVILINPYTYKLTHNVLTYFKFDPIIKEDGHLTILGMFVHSFVFYILTCVFILRSP